MFFFVGYEANLQQTKSQLYESLWSFSHPVFNPCFLLQQSDAQ